MNSLFGDFTNHHLNVPAAGGGGGEPEQGSRSPEARKFYCYLHTPQFDSESVWRRRGAGLCGIDVFAFSRSEDKNRRSPRCR